MPDKYAIKSAILNLIQEGMKNGTIRVSSCQAFFFSGEQLNIDLKIRHTCIKISGQTFPWADKGPA